MNIEVWNVSVFLAVQKNVVGFLLTWFVKQPDHTSQVCFLIITYHRWCHCKPTSKAPIIPEGYRCWVWSAIVTKGCWNLVLGLGVVEIRIHASTKTVDAGHVYWNVFEVFSRAPAFPKAWIFCGQDAWPRCRRSKHCSSNTTWTWAGILLGQTGHWQDDVPNRC